MSTIVKRAWGRLWGLDRSGYGTNSKGIAVPEIKIGPSDSEISAYGANSVETNATTLGTLTGAGTSILSTTKIGAFTLPAPVAPGVTKRIVFQGGTTAARKVSAASGTIVSTDAAGTSITAASTAGDNSMSATLLALTTAVWQLVGRFGVTNLASS